MTVPTVVEAKVDAFAHCTNSRCAGNRQEIVKAVVKDTSISFVDSGGDMPGVEKTSRHVVFANEKRDATCPVCQGPREVTLQKRPVYANLSGHAQDGILTLKLPDGDFVKPAEESEELAELKAQVEKLSGIVAKQATAGAQ